MATPPSNASESGPHARVILQQCLSAKLQLQPPNEEKPGEYVQINKGLVVYVCFLRGATESIIDKMVKCVLQTKLSTSEAGKLVSILDLPGDVLIVPQATLGGRLKGKLMQYHNNIDKATGRDLYYMFAENCTRIVEENCKCKEQECVVKCGTYGNLQVLNMDTNGPYSHMIEF